MNNTELVPDIHGIIIEFLAKNQIKILCIQKPEPSLFQQNGFKKWNFSTVIFINKYQTRIIEFFRRNVKTKKCVERLPNIIFSVLSILIIKTHFIYLFILFISFIYFHWCYESVRYTQPMNIMPTDMGLLSRHNENTCTHFI